MRVLHIFNELKFSGAEIMYVDASNIFKKLGCQLYALITGKNEGAYTRAFLNNGYKIEKITLVHKWNILEVIQFSNKLSKFLDTNQIDIVHLHRSDILFIVSTVSWLKKRKCIYTVHNVFQSKFYTRGYHILLRKIAIKIYKTQFQTISDSVYENELNYYKTNSHKIYNWYNSERYYKRSNEEYHAMRKVLSLSNKQFTIISIGGCSHIKRHHDILTAIHLLQLREYNIKYLHLGTGATEQEEIEMSEQLGIGPCISFLGNQTDVRKYLVAADLYVMTSKFEGISLTTIEAMAVNVPTLVYDVPGLRDFNTNKLKTTIMISEDSAILAETIGAVIQKKIDTDALIEIASEHVSNTYNMEKNAKEIYKLYSC